MRERRTLWRKESPSRPSSTGGSARPPPAPDGVLGGIINRPVIIGSFFNWDFASSICTHGLIVTGY